MLTNQSPAPSESKAADSPIDRLQGLIAELDPFLGDCGTACCKMTVGDSKLKITWRLNDGAVSDLLAYRYYAKYKEAPSAREIGAALAIIRGELWHTRREPIITDACPTLRTMRKAAENMESWSGSASDLLNVLRKVAHEYALLKENEELPKNEDAMGIWLSKNALPLRAYHIEVWRPKPTARSRLWAWRRVALGSDTSDASHGQSAQPASAATDRQVHITSDADTFDAFSEEQQRIWNEYNGDEK